MARRLFLERRTYRQSRLRDAARLLPILGVILIFGPIFIRDDGGGAPTLAGELVYYFAIWLGLIALSALMSRAMIGAASPDPKPDPNPNPDLKTGTKPEPKAPDPSTPHGDS
ncbi:MAG: hypothetical protein JKY00_07780 [Roseicyclus sp.]|nr:hypothetical protein [Roseicyclus sp.]